MNMTRAEVRERSGSCCGKNQKEFAIKRGQRKKQARGTRACGRVEKENSEWGGPPNKG